LTQDAVAEHLEQGSATASPHEPARTPQTLRRAAALRLRSHRETLAPYLFIAPGFALFALVILFPIGRAFQISLYNWSIVPGATSDYLGFANYGRALHDPVFWRALGNTAFYMGVTVPAQMVLGLTAAVLLDARMPARSLFRTLYYLPVVTSWVVVSLLFRYLFLTDGGFVNWVLHDTLHVTDHDIAWLGSRWPAMTTIAILGIWKGVGWSMVIFLAALQGVPRELHEAAAVDGAKAWRRFLSISLPELRPVVAFVTVMLVIGGFNVFISVFLITAGGPLDSTQVLLTYMYRQAFTFLDFGYGSAISFMLTLIVAALSLVQMRIFRRRGAVA
jgi:multiple sugar transport system permease protein